MHGSYLNIQQFGARGNRITNNTIPIQRAIDKVGELGGGTVLFPAGTYLTGAISLKSNVTLYLEAGAVLLGSTSFADYPILQSRWEGKTRETFAPLIGGDSLENVSIMGRGTIDGQGEVFWTAFKNKELEYPRPKCISFSNCRNIHIEGITIRNSPSWTIHPAFCENVVIRAVTIMNPADSPNTDGINPESCKGVHISDCFISVGDDCIALKAGVEDEAQDLWKACEDIAITNCIMERGHGGIVFGSETTGGIRNVVVSNCIFRGTDRGIRLKTRRGRGGGIESIRVSNCLMESVLSSFTVNMFYGCGAWGNPTVFNKEALPITTWTPLIRDVHITGITARKVKLAAAFLYGLPEQPVRDVSLTDWAVEMDTEHEDGGEVEMAEGLPRLIRAGVYVKHVRDLFISNFHLTHVKDDPFYFEDVEGGELHNLRSYPSRPGKPVFSLPETREVKL